MPQLQRLFSGGPYRFLQVPATIFRPHSSKPLSACLHKESGRSSNTSAFIAIRRQRTANLFSINDQGFGHWEYDQEVHHKWVGRTTGAPRLRRPDRPHRLSNQRLYRELDGMAAPRIERSALGRKGDFSHVCRCMVFVSDAAPLLSRSFFPWSCSRQACRNDHARLTDTSPITNCVPRDTTKTQLCVSDNIPHSRPIRAQPYSCCSCLAVWM